MLENGKQAQHDAALKILQRRLSLREVARAKQLVAAGVNNKIADITAKTEFEEDNKKQTEEYEENILKDQTATHVSIIAHETSWRAMKRITTTNQRR